MMTQVPQQSSAIDIPARADALETTMKAFSWASTSAFSRRGANRTNSLSAAPPGQRRAYTSAPTLYSNSPTSCRTPCTRSCSLRATEPWIPCDGTRSRICSAGAGRSWAHDIRQFAGVHYWTKGKIQRLGFETPIPAPLPGGGGALPCWRQHFASNDKRAANREGLCGHYINRVSRSSYCHPALSHGGATYL